MGEAGEKALILRGGPATGSPGFKTKVMLGEMPPLSLLLIQSMRTSMLPASANTGLLPPGVGQPLGEGMVQTTSQVQSRADKLQDARNAYKIHQRHLCQSHIPLLEERARHQCQLMNVFVAKSIQDYCEAFFKDKYSLREQAELIETYKDHYVRNFAPRDGTENFRILPSVNSTTFAKIPAPSPLHCFAFLQQKIKSSEFDRAVVDSMAEKCLNLIITKLVALEESKYEVQARQELEGRIDAIPEIAAGNFGKIKSQSWLIANDKLVNYPQCRIVFTPSKQKIAADITQNLIDIKNLLARARLEIPDLIDASRIGNSI